MTVSIKDIAVRVGVAPSTVTKALRGYQGVSQKTRESVERAARDLGYQPNALLSAWMTRVRKADRSELQSVLGVLVAIPFRGNWLKAKSGSNFKDGVQRRAKEMGWTVELLPYANERDLEGQLRIAHSRGIRALLFTQVPEAMERLEIDADLLAPFALMALGMSLKKPHVHRVGPDHYGALRRVLATQLQPNMGPVGLMVEAEQDRRLNQVWSSAFRGWRFPEGTWAVPVFELGNDDANGASGVEALERWLATHACNLVFSTHFRASKLFSDHSSDRCPLVRVDEDLEGSRDRVSSLHNEVGETAVELLVGNLLRGELGPPKSPRAVLVGSAF